MWHNDPTTRRIIQEVAEDFNITPNDVLGVLTSFFDQILNLSKGIKVKMFTVIGLGKIIAKGHIPKRVNAAGSKRLRVDALIKEQVKEEPLEQ
jgi:hypothetical protein